MPVETIRFRMEQAGLKQKDLVPFVGTKSKVSEVLSGKRPFSINMIRRLHEGLDIPFDILMKDSQPIRMVAEDAVEYKTREK